MSGAPREVAGEELTGPLAVLNGVRLHGLQLSYFSGKLEAYLRYCGIPYVFVSLDSRGFRRVGEATGMTQMPALELADGRWMTDTTAIIRWIEARRDCGSIIPADPEQAFFSRVLEDFADEWLWRPALHYRWSYGRDARLLGEQIARELLRDAPGPLWLKRMIVIRRQRAKYLAGDGVTAATRPHIEAIYRQALAWMTRTLADGPFLLGARPTLADFGFMGPMLRHFSSDPTPSEIMRRAAPAVASWVARMWDAKATSVGSAKLYAGIPQTWDELLSGLGLQYFQYLSANAGAHRAGLAQFQWLVDGVAYTLPVNRYRIHALNELQSAFAALPPAAADAVRERLLRLGVWSTLWRTPYPVSGFDPHHRLPFLRAKDAWSWRPPAARRPVHDGLGR